MNTSAIEKQALLPCGSVRRLLRRSATEVGTATAVRYGMLRVVYVYAAGHSAVVASSGRAAAGVELGRKPGSNKGFAVTSEVKARGGETTARGRRAPHASPRFA